MYLWPSGLDESGPVVDRLRGSSPMFWLLPFDLFIVSELRAQFRLVHRYSAWKILGLDVQNES